MRRLLTQTTARTVDEKLMGQLQFSIDQLMELAGLAVAQAIHKEYQPCTLLVVCGPGNNGGDGLVAARHLKHFGFAPIVLYPKHTINPLYLRLIEQCTALGVEVKGSIEDFNEFTAIVDAIFGFSFTGEIRAPFDSVIKSIKECHVDIISIDIPSGWDVERGNIDAKGLVPKMLISLTAPKLCASGFLGIHYVGGRFIPAALAEEFQFDLPLYSGSDQVVRIE